MKIWKGELMKIDEFRYMIPRGYKREMRTDGIIYADSKLIESVVKDNAPEQVANVATLPGIQGKSLAMPDIHWGYGFPIGGVAAMDAEEGIISPGGVGYDINCGVRLIKTNLRVDDIKEKVRELISAMFYNVPSGVGSKGKISVDVNKLNDVLALGARWGYERGYGWDEDLKHIEENGTFKNAEPSYVSMTAKKRGASQLGTLGAGNHFLEIQKVEKIYDKDVAKKFGIDELGQVMVMVHTGSRGCGHQICTDYVNALRSAVKKYGISLPDKQLVCAPANSKEGERYFKAMACGANYAWANRQMITHWVRESFEKVLGMSAEDLDMKIVYDVAHNIAKLEEHEIDGRKKMVYVHRKGATRAFGPGHSEIPSDYIDVGQPVIIPGDMGTASYLLVGTEQAMKETFGSTCHGAGRVMSRHEAVRRYNQKQVIEMLAQKGIYARGATKTVMAEEAPAAYKNVDNVVDVCHGAGISKKIAKFIPLGVMKG